MRKIATSLYFNGDATDSLWCNCIRWCRYNIAANPAENMAAPLLSQALSGDLLMSFVSVATFATILAVVAGFIGGWIGTLVGARANQRKYWIEINIVITTRKSRRYELVTLSLIHTFCLFVKVLVP